MIFYTLDENFLKKDVIDTFVSGIWTERYSLSGDVNLVVEETSENVTKLATGTFLALPDESDEVMIIDTRSIENKLLTVTGSSLLEFLKERIVWKSQFGTTAIGFEFDDNPAGTTINQLVWYTCIRPDLGSFGEGSDTNLDWEKDTIPNLSLGAEDSSGGSIEVIYVPIGTVYDGIQPLAETYHVGMSLYLESADDDGYSLVFKTYQGEDHTNDQDVNPLVRFSPALGSLNNIKELNSIVGYKNVAYAFAEGYPLQTVSASGLFPEGFERRVLLLTVDDIPESMDPDNVPFALFRRAQDALANNNYVKLVDGEVVPQGDYQYGVHYGLGDIIELQGTDPSISVQKARITEYIRSQDATGKRAYPTISVID